MKKIITLISLAFLLNASIALADVMPPGQKYISGCAILQNVSIFPNIKFIAAYYTNDYDNPYPTKNSPSKIVTLENTTCIHSELKADTVELYALDPQNYQKNIQNKEYNPAQDINAYVLPPLEVLEGSTLNTSDQLIDIAAKDSYYHRIYNVKGIDNGRRFFFLSHLEDKTDLSTKPATETPEIPLNLDTSIKTDTPIFKDVLPNSPYAMAVLSLKRKGVIQGYTDGNYRLTNLINRAEFIKIVMTNYPGIKDPDCSIKIFKDVSTETSNWFRNAVCQAYHEGIITGYKDMTFGPNLDINFAEASKIIVNAYNVAPVDKTDPWYKQFTSVFEKFNGVPSSIKSPDQKITRGEMALLMYKMDQHVWELR